MGEPPDDLVALVRDLERRVSALERRAEPTLEPVPVSSAGGEGAVALPSIPGGMFPVLGRALLGIAGAYLLRAIAEYRAVPRLAAVLAALIYAAWWLVSSSRVAAENRFTTAVYGLTAAAVMSPMLWETTVRLQVLPPRITAAVLVTFVVLGAALAWPRNLTVITWITTLAGVATAVALIVATGEIVPFTIALLVMAIVVEYAACRDHWLGERWIVALTADFAVFLLSYLVTRPSGMPEGYAAAPVTLVIAIQIALLSIYLGSTVYRTLIHDLTITTFEIGQAVVAFLISIGGALEVTRRATAASTVVGLFAILSGTACYLVAFGFLERRAGRQRNLYTYTSFGLALVLTACYVLASGALLVAIWSVIAVAAMWVGEHVNRTILRMHAAGYLVAGAVAAGLLAGPPGRVAIVTAAGVACYALARNTAGALVRVPSAVIAAVLCWNILGLAPGLLGPADASIMATVRTALVCVLAIAFAWAGRRWDRRELTWLLYPLMILGAFKLVAEDFRQGRAATLWLSLVCYGGALILVPRLVRSRLARQQRQEVETPVH
jgi:hypothetical protein